MEKRVGEGMRSATLISFVVLVYGHFLRYAVTSRTWKRLSVAFRTIFVVSADGIASIFTFITYDDDDDDDGHNNNNGNEK